MDTSMNPSERTAEDLAAIRRPKVIKIATLAAIFMTFFILSIGSVFTYWAFTGKDVLVFRNDPFPVKPKFLKSEEYITLAADFCKVVDTRGVTTAVMVSNKTRIGIYMQPETLPKGCYKFSLEKAEFKIPIPPQTPPDMYHIEFRQVYKTNPLHTVTETVNSDTFQIIQ